MLIIENTYSMHFKISSDHIVKNFITLIKPELTHAQVLKFSFIVTVIGFSNIEVFYVIIPLPYRNDPKFSDKQG